MFIFKKMCLCVLLRKVSSRLTFFGTIGTGSGTSLRPLLLLLLLACEPFLMLLCRVKFFFCKMWIISKRLSQTFVGAYAWMGVISSVRVSVHIRALSESLHTWQVNISGHAVGAHLSYHSMGYALVRALFVCLCGWVCMWGACKSHTSKSERTFAQSAVFPPSPRIFTTYDSNVVFSSESSSNSLGTSSSHFFSTFTILKKKKQRRKYNEKLCRS